ncbi:two-component system, OmpR family, response regulator/two-component system, OmpR family, response regulator TctD [Franzmannia pantelleriensis]|uniref:Two-component system, OmpR family, response regulator/two-component system, OmpR family, response regulator TctD n=1 Tax=Franzmannia pantelleriensis TaxID=48727 RepID=A0A1G9U2J5_9GAMM|nr:response regulator transcription factor [Halomonas pantelleriensis]SDM53735.1 two-component system, OmpR family, response regulator/two-component system, OmpR family, response regulator TctD [Halomonas pantelleriensis]
MKVLVVEDNDNLARSISAALEDTGFKAEVSRDGRSAEHCLELGAYDLLVLDLGLPELDGISLLRRLRQRQDTIPVLIISARDALDQRILGLEEGADDYLCKPFSLDEVAARAKALVRRAKQFGGETLCCGRLELQPDAMELRLDGDPVVLHRRELEVLEYLMINQGRLVSKGQIADRLSTTDDLVSHTAVETYVSRLRKKLGVDVGLKTVRGLGYLLDPQDAG